MGEATFAVELLLAGVPLERSRFYSDIRVCESSRSITRPGYASGKSRRKRT